ncbi:MAG: DUF3987 domain-containing protein [Bryobacteraceae bacterium]
MSTPSDPLPEVTHQCTNQPFNLPDDLTVESDLSGNDPCLSVVLADSAASNTRTEACQAVSRPHLVPAELRELDQFVLWRYEIVDGRLTKVPKQANGRSASTTNSKTWCSFEEARRAYNARPGYFSGIGFVFREEDGIVGIDLDDCLDETGELKGWAHPIWASFPNTYCEISPSHKGVKIFAKARLEGRGKHLEGGDHAIEMYNQGRYFTLTALVFKDAPSRLEEHQAAVDALWDIVSRPRRAKPSERADKPSDIADNGDKVPQGSRHKYLVRSAGYLRNCGFSGEAIRQALFVENSLRCDPPHSPEHIEQIAASAANWPAPAHIIRVSQPLEWQEPVELGSDLPPVAPFCEDLLPDRLRGLALDSANRMQVPPDFAAVGTLASLYGAINRRCKIQPKANDTSWKVTPNLWGAIIAPPGLLKSPLIEASLRPLKRIERGWRQLYAEAQERYKDELELHDIKVAAWRTQALAAEKTGGNVPVKPQTPKAPECKRNIVNDATFEAVHAAMSTNPAGVFLVRDELTGWLTQMDRPGREGERAFYLEAWNGDGSYTIDRIGRGVIHVDACCISLFGGIQPARLRSYISDTIRDGPANDGLIQRFQVMVWPDVPRHWEYVDRPPNAEAEEVIQTMLSKILSLDSENPLVYRFCPEAQELFIHWLSELEAKVRGDDLHPALIAHLSKYRSLMPSLALIFELSDYICGTGSGSLVSPANAAKAALWCDYFESHATRVYSCIVTPQLRLARELAEKIKKRKLDAIFSVRDVYLKGWSGLDSPEAARQAVEVLTETHWIRPYVGDEGTKGGRPSEQYEINPAVFQ